MDGPPKKEKEKKRTIKGYGSAATVSSDSFSELSVSAKVISESSTSLKSDIVVDVQMIV